MKVVHSSFNKPLERPSSSCNKGKPIETGNKERKKKDKQPFLTSAAKSISQFFDDNVTVQVYGGRLDTAQSSTSNQGTPRKLDVVVSNGKLSANPQVLKEQCEKDFDTKWFLKEDKQKLLIDRTAKIEVFQVDKTLSCIPMILPRAELDPQREKYVDVELLETEEDDIDKGEAALQSIDPYYSGQLKSLSVISNGSAGQTSVASNQNNEIMSVARLLEDFEASVYSAPYLKQSSKISLITANRPSTAPSVLKAIGGGEFESHRMRQLILDKQRRSIENLYRSKSGALRPNNPLKTVTPDYVLFVESLRRDILLYPSESVDSKRCMVNHENSLEDELDEFNCCVVQNSISTLHLNTNSQTSNGVDPVKDYRQRHPLMSLVDDDVLIVQNSRILSLDLSNRGIGPDRGQCLAVALQYCPHLQILKLKNNRLNDITLSVILQAAFGFAQLQYLDFSENDAHRQTSAVLCNYIESVKNTEERTMHQSLGTSLFENSVSSSVHSSTKCVLEYIDMSHCNVGDELSGKIAGALSRNDTIREFHISANRIGTDESQASLAWSELLQKNQTLAALNMSFNYLRRYPAQLLLKSLHYNRTLVYLNLSNNQISDQDVVVSASFLEKNTTLQSLDLSFNMIENRGCIALSYCLSQLSCVNFTQLNLLNNKIGDIGYKFAVERMLFVLHQNYELHYAVYHQEKNKMVNNVTIPVKKTVRSQALASVYDELNGIRRENDQSEINKPPAPVDASPVSPRIYRLLSIICFPIKNNDRVAFSSWSTNLASAVQFNPLELSGKHELQLSDAFDYIRARICMDAIEQNPCILVKEFKWYNDVVNGFEYPSISRHIHSNLSIVKPIMDAIHHVCSDETRGLANCTPRVLYEQEYPNVVMTGPFDQSHHLLTLLYRLIHLLNKSVEEKLKANHLLEVKSVLLDLGQRLSFNITPELMFFLLEKWHRLDAMHSRYRIGEIYNPWKQQVSLHDEKEGGSSKKSSGSKRGSSGKGPSVYQDIEEALQKERESSSDGEILISDPVVIVKFLICNIYDYIKQYSTEMNIQQFYQNQHIFAQAQLLTAKYITLQRFANTNNQNSKSTLKVASAFEIYPPDHEKIQMNPYELLVRMITELTFQYNNSTGMSAVVSALNGVDTDQSISNPGSKKVFELPTNKNFGTATKKSSEVEDDEALQDPIEECFVHATQFLQYILLQIQNFMMVTCPYQSVKIVSNSIPDVRNDLPSHGILTLEMHVPSLQSSFHKAFTPQKHYLFDAFLTTLCYDYASYNHDRILYQSQNDSMKLFSNVANLTGTLLQILEYDDNILHLTCEQAELVLKIVFAAKKGFHLNGIERLLFQIADSNDIRRFIIRNCYFHEIIWLRKKLSFLFKVFVGNLNGHYLLDLSDATHRRAALRLAALHNEQLYLVQHHIHLNKSGERTSTSKKGSSSKPSIETSPPCFVMSEDIEKLFFRNSSYNGSYINITSEWLQQLPAVGKLRFDYSAFLEPTDFLTHFMPASVLSHTNIGGSSLLETTLFHERYHQLHGNLFGSCFNMFGVRDARLQTSLVANRTTIDHAYNRVYSNAYQLILRNQKYHYNTNDDRVFQAELLKKEGFADLLIQQMFTKDVYKLSLKIYKKLKIPPKNSAVYDINDPACREYVKRLRSIERANALAKPVSKQNDVLNIMMRRYHRPALGGYHGANANSNPSPTTITPEMEKVATPQKDVLLTSAAGSVLEEEENDDDDDDDLESDEGDGPSTKMTAADKKKAALLAASATEPGNNGLSRESYFRLQDQSSNLDTGARQAFFMRAVPSQDKSSGQDSNYNSPVSKKVGLHDPNLPSCGNNVDKHYDTLSLSVWKDYLETAWSSYNACYQEYTMKKAQQIFAQIQKENSHNHQYHYSAGSENLPDEVFQSSLFLELAKTSIQSSIVFNINGGKRRKTQLTFISSPSQEPSKTPQRRTPTVSSIGSPQHSGSKASISSTTDLLTPAALQCAPFELSLLILETCCLFNVWMEVVQIKSILEALKSQKAPHEVMVRAVSMLWKYIIDRENLAQCVRKVCGEGVYIDCIHRIGYLLFWSPLHPEGKYDFDMTDRQHRDVLSILASLLLEDETIEGFDCQYQPSRLHQFETIDIAQFALTPPHSIGTRTNASEKAVRSQPKSRQNTSKGQGGRSVASNNSKEPVGQVPKEGLNIPLSGVTPSKNYSPTASTAFDGPGKFQGVHESTNSSNYPIDVLARQQAVRRVYSVYKQSLVEQYVLSPFMEEATGAKNAMNPYYAHMLFPMIK